MRTAIILGNGPIIDELAPRFLQKQDEFVFFGVSRFIGDLKAKFDPIEPIKPLRLGRSIKQIKSTNATNISFVGGAGDLLDFATGRMGMPDRSLLHYIKQYVKASGTFAPPHSVLSATKIALEENNINLSSIIDIFPDVSIGAGSFFGDPPAVDLNNNIAAARIELEKQPFYAVRQAFIAKNGVILEREHFGTSKMIDNFANSNRNAGRSMLIKMAVEPFVKIDTPVVGIETVVKCLECGISGIAVEANKTIVVQKEEILKLCDGTNFFLYGF